ncbi:ergosterol biosynthesis ERG4/ERG24 family-domain-containing protein [Rhypophila decipiens]|uniref:Delta(24(24(1)))-sterol reductase n=1 Tax=Rhypophila decipiens TaxID=261697 RepID=A0AAN7B873_9PEZI|nr:ergosterol biosynthesis ERG4/ERG24 family-domain-containing protein [Rhypophila decipiens]
MSTRYSLRQTPRKKELFEGMVETPARRSMRRKSQFPLESDGESSSAAENVSKPSLQKRRTAKFIEHLDEELEMQPTPHKTPSDDESRPLLRTANGNGNGHSNGKASNGHAKAAKPEEKVVDGWKPGMDPKIDYSGHKEFGGAWGTGTLMIFFPVLMWYMWIGATIYDGKIPLPTKDQSLVEFVSHLANLVYTQAFPHAKAWAMYWTFLVFEGALYIFAPGVYAYGKPLPHEGGKQLRYYCSAYTSFYTTIVFAAALHFSGLFPLYTIIDEFGPLLSVAIISGWSVAIIAYVSAFYRGATHRMTGSHVYDFFMGAELNPRMFGILDFKMFFEVRLPWYILFLLTSATAARQYERYGYVSGEVCFMWLAHYLYANACSKGEELIVPTWDMYYEKWGFMLIFWNLAGVPLSYCHSTLYLASHEPETYRMNRVVLALFFAAYIFVYWVWDSCNGQKNSFRAMESGKFVKRNTFPQVPWQSIKNPKTIETGQANKILCDGWYGLARKVHYSCDVFFAVSWGLITGFDSVFPWFYPVFFCCMITHRCWRDIQRCRNKYGDAWTEYEKRVPYLLIPGVI